MQRVRPAKKVHVLFPETEQNGLFIATHSANNTVHVFFRGQRKRILALPRYFHHPPAHELLINATHTMKLPTNFTPDTAALLPIQWSYILRDQTAGREHRVARELGVRACLNVFRPG